LKEKKISKRKKGKINGRPFLGRKENRTVTSWSSLVK
jgi:hypothetical protein